MPNSQIWHNLPHNKRPLHDITTFQQNATPTVVVSSDPAIQADL
jgi:hypothetical protein